MAAERKYVRNWLFHGCGPDVVDKILQQGFNRSFCGKNATFYGKGVYFRDASYSTFPLYSPADGRGLQTIFAVRVVVGAWSKGVKDALTPDVRDARRNLLYDTTVDNMADPSIFVITTTPRPTPSTASASRSRIRRRATRRPVAPPATSRICWRASRTSSRGRRRSTRNNTTTTTAAGGAGPRAPARRSARRSAPAVHGPDSRGRRAGRGDDRESSGRAAPPGTGAGRGGSRQHHSGRGPPQCPSCYGPPSNVLNSRSILLLPC